YLLLLREMFQTSESLVLWDLQTSASAVLQWISERDLARNIWRSSERCIPDSCGPLISWAPTSVCPWILHCIPWATDRTSFLTWVCLYPLPGRICTRCSPNSRPTT